MQIVRLQAVENIVVTTREVRLLERIEWVLGTSMLLNFTEMHCT